MTVEVTIALPESVVEQAKWLGNATLRDVDVRRAVRSRSVRAAHVVRPEYIEAEVIADTLSMLWSALEGQPDSSFYPPVSSLSDAEVLKLADAKMDAVQNDRLGELQARGKATGLTEAEQMELLALMQIYQIGQLRKSEALAEAVQRGLLIVNC